MRGIAVCLRRYGATIPPRLLASVLIFIALAQVFWIALIARLIVPAPNGIASRFQLFATQSAQRESGAVLALGLLALILAGIPYESRAVFAAGIISVCFLGYFAMDIPLAASPIAVRLRPGLEQDVSERMGDFAPLLVSVSVLAPWFLCNAARGMVKNAIRRARRPQGVADEPVAPNPAFVTVPMRRRCLTIPVTTLLLTACASVSLLMRSACRILRPNQYAVSYSASTWLLCGVLLIAASLYISLLNRNAGRQYLIAFLIGIPALTLCPHAVTLPGAGSLSADANAFWIGLLAYPLVAGTGYVCLATLLHWDTGWNTGIRH